MRANRTKRVKGCSICGGSKPEGRGARYCDPCSTERPCRVCEHPLVKGNPRTVRGVSYARWFCRACELKKKNEKYKNDPDSYNLRRNAQKYNLTIPEYEALLKGGKCSICGESPTGLRHESKLHVDHDHRTGSARGALCGRCNRALGLLREDRNIILKMVEYLDRTATSVLD